MEIIDGFNHKDKSNSCCSKESSMGRNIYFGVLLVSLGVVWLLNNFDIISSSVFSTIFSWQMLIIIIGGYLLSLRSWISGGIVAGIGIILLCTRILGIDIPMEKLFIPLILISVGAVIICSRLCCKR